MTGFFGKKYLLTVINARNVKVGRIDEIQNCNIEADSTNNYHYASKPQIFIQSISYIELQLFSV